MNANHEKKHFHYTLLVVAAEFGMTFSFHMLPAFHLNQLALWLGISSFAIYTLVSMAYLRQSVQLVRTDSKIQLRVKAWRRRHE